MTSSDFDINKFQQDLLNSDPLVRHIWDDKYRLKNADGSSPEPNVMATRERVVRAVYLHDHDPVAKSDALVVVGRGLLIPAGRVNAGAGTGRAVTLINCFVEGTIQDSMPGIQIALSQSAFTMQQGGGIGGGFSTIRPRGAIVRRTGSTSSGVIPFMDYQSAMCDTIISASTRRGAMMAVLSDTHPDLWDEDQYKTHIHPSTGELVLTHPTFISAKQQKGRLLRFNVSVAISDAFMTAVNKDLDWDLGFHVPRADGRHVDVYDRPFLYDEVDYTNSLISTPTGVSKGQMKPWFVYKRVKARRIWGDLMRGTYKYSEPGVLFIDRINDRNNLSYCEDISATNPCGEQPLPPYGACCLASCNLAFMVDNPFTPSATFRWDILERTVKTGVRFLDNVLDITQYPLEEQRNESMQKRRIGLGPTGFADALIQLGITYGSDESTRLEKKIGTLFKHSSYAASVDLAKIRGPFPLFDADKFCSGFNIQDLPKDLVHDINQYGIRNGVLNTIAPNGTISIYVGNISSGHEPVFSFNKTHRKVLNPDGSATEFVATPYSYALYEAMYGKKERNQLPEYFVGAMDISIEAHLKVHATWQQYIDSSISKTINVPTDTSYSAFESVYFAAYTLGCKGCTTYRYDPTSGRGSVLSEEPKQPESEPKAGTNPGAYMGVGADEIAADNARTAVPVSTSLSVPPMMPAQRVVEARRYRLKWPQTGENWYIAISRCGNTPFEVFITSSNAQASEWIQAMSRLLTAVLRRGGDVIFLINELTSVHSAMSGAFIPEQHKYRPSIVAAIGGVLEEEFRTLGLMDKTANARPEQPQQARVMASPVHHGGGPSTECCPECGGAFLVHEQGCIRCLACDYNKCG